MPSPPMRLILALLCAVTLLAAAGAAFPDDIEAPPELQEFWKRWVEAKAKNNDDDLDTVVRRYREDADMMLNTLLDDVSKRDDLGLPFEIRLLAWSLDRVERTERYITRTRFVLDLDLRDRGRRSIAMGRWERGLGLEDEARKQRSVDAWKAALDEYEGAAAGFAEVGDTEFRVFCFVRCSEIEFERQRFWYQAKYLKQVKDLAATLPYDDAALGMATDRLKYLADQGIDPEGPETSGKGGAPGGEAGPGGTGLTSFRPNTEPVTYPLEFQTPKKGLPLVSLPSFHQPDQYQLWQQTYIKEEGPSEFDFLRTGRFKPDGANWTLSRDGIETFQIDTDGDGKPEATFPGSSTPTRIEVKTAKGTVWPVMVAALSQREPMFNAEYNYAPTADGARLRIYLASFWEGDVLGETWQVFDTNMDGAFGVAWENFDDLVTDYTDESTVSYFEPDGVLIGKAKKAIPLSEVMPVGESFYRVTPDTAAGTITLQEMNLATGQVLVDIDTKVLPSHLLVREIGGGLEGSYFDILPERKGKPVTLPVGTYQICMGRIAKGAKTSQDQVRIYTGDSAPFTVADGKTTKLELGAPFALRFRLKRDGGEVLLDTRTIRVFGRFGEEYAMFFDEALQPTVEVRDGDGKKVGKPTKLRQVGVGEWERNTGADNILWFPYEHRVEAAADQVLEMKLTQKAHSLIGGPLESDWIR